ncbi:cytochrome-c peroxidase [Flavobacterium sp. WG21]|uniref:cytochrome-c peroxidase n=1 Tax=Flavobacterium sp. WG21 TaxID=1229487 RepID=UPI000347A5CF|nr:cytochrome c peroxidase [Flavobacterium sp. WG21]
MGSYKPLKIILTVLAPVVIFSNLSFDENIDSVKLGKKLFFDPMLSSDNSISCASCHKPEFAFADNVSLSKGVNSRMGERNTPSVMYSDERLSFFWDGRSKSLEHQAFFPITHPNEMNLSEEEAIRRINQSESYIKDFIKVFNAKPNKVLISKALADYQRSLKYYNSPYDRFSAGDDQALSDSALRGLILFNGKGNCTSCHEGKDQTSDGFFNIGLYNELEYRDKGRFDLVKDSTNLGRFKTPTLRNIELTAPYMHNGSMATLEQVIEYYNNPDLHIKNSIGRDKLITKSLGLSKKEMIDLKAFLLSLTDDNLK